jgi:hypothetical protein
MDPIRFTCATCGEVHEGLPDIGFDAPSHYRGAEGTRGTRLTSDHCVIEERDYFVHGCLEIPIVGSDARFAWGVWISLSRKNFDRYVALRGGDPPPGEGPYPGWFCSAIPGYPDTLQLRARAHLRPGGLRPLIELEPTDHPLAVHQRNGIALETLLELVRPHLHHP